MCGRDPNLLRLAHARLDQMDKRQTLDPVIIRSRPTGGNVAGPPGALAFDVKPEVA